jgi:hypothetical protein
VNTTTKVKALLAAGLFFIALGWSTLRLPAQSPTPVATLTEDQKWDAFYTLRGQGTWADYGLMSAPANQLNGRSDVIDSTIGMYPTSTEKDKLPAQEVNQPKYNLMAPNFWAQFETK